MSMKIKDLTTGQIFEYGSDRHHSLKISGDGRTLSFEHLQNGDGSRYGDYRFVDDYEEVIPSESECSCRHGADSYFDIGGFAEEYNNGWIPCEVRLPEEDGKRYIVQKTNGFIDILIFTKNAYKLSRYDFAEYKGKEKPLFYDYDSEYGYTEWECEAWMPLPAPYKKGE